MKKCREGYAEVVSKHRKSKHITFIDALRHNCRGSELVLGLDTSSFDAELSAESNQNIRR